MADSYAALDRQVRWTAPKWLRRLDMIDAACSLDALPKIGSWEEWKSSWPTIIAVKDSLPDVVLVDRESVEPAKNDARADGWLRDNEDGKWAAQEAHYRSIGGITQSGYQSNDFGPLIIPKSSEVKGAVYQIIRHCVYTLNTKGGL